METATSRLRAHAARVPDKPAIVFPAGRTAEGKARWESVTFRELDRRSDQYARGFSEKGVRRGDRSLFLVRPSLDFYAALFGLMKLGAVPVLVDPGMGMRNMLQCIGEARPRVVVALPIIHAIRTFVRKPFAATEVPITAGARWFWGGATLAQCSSENDARFDADPPLGPQDDLIIAFTSGSTGTPKGVVFKQGMFPAQAAAFQAFYDLGPEDVIVECFASFVLYDVMQGLTVVVPEMNLSKPATADPAKVVEAIQDHGAAAAFASPIVWLKVAPWCQQHGVKLPSLRKVLTAGAPIPVDLHKRFREILQDGAEIQTPYGATEALPLTNIGGNEILAETSARTVQGFGTCVGSPAPNVKVHIVRITDDPIPEWRDELLLAQGEVGEVVAEGGVVSPAYLDRPDANAVSKIRKGEVLLHRMGDLGYLDERGRLWFCGRKAHALHTAQGLVPSGPVEGIFDTHPKVLRTALVGVGGRGSEIPVLCVEMRQGEVFGEAVEKELRALAVGTRYEGLVKHVVASPGFPVDARHNSKIRREDLKAWVEKTQPQWAQAKVAA